MRTLSLVLAFTLPCALAARPQPTKPPDIGKRVSERILGLLNTIDDDADFARVSKDLTSLFDQLIAYAPIKESGAFREAAFARRLVHQLSQVKKSRVDLFTYLRANPQLAEALAFLVQPEDKVEAVYALLDKLRLKHGTDLNRLASLTAALCVVHDQPLTDRINENSARAADPVLIFEYFKRHERRMYYPPATMPAELLISVVNATASIADLEWALGKYAGDARVGRRYFDVRYDTAHFRTGEEKKLTKAGYSLPNILKHGGICADQSYFAQQVGKALAIPTAGISGQNASMAHAWVGFFEVVTDNPRWNFDSGHYEDYENIRGGTTDPQTRRSVPDSWLALTVDSSTGGATNRRTAIAFMDASLRLQAIQKSPDRYPPTGETTVPIRQPARTADIAGRLDLLEAGLRLCPSHGPAWQVLVAASGELSLKHKKYWADALFKLCGDKNPDFTLGILAAMVRTELDVAAQNDLWDSLYQTYQKRPDLAAEVRFNQGGMWEKSGEKSRAWGCYQEVFLRFANEGPFAVAAASQCERLLRANKKDADVSPMYAELWKRTKRPGASIAPEFKKQSNWYRVGKLYATSLQRDGNTRKASDVREDLER
jgi:hypothetical protein